ncbi:MAG: hypothetical protein DLM58_13160 [Pseudonocardiales bacterium]|nr:MAG: hypothetical protein DLM58_13160 [Pseudonocardiales bacterium]
MADFETFRKPLVALKREPTITIQKRGTMSLNKAAQVALGSPAAVELLFDAARRIVGLRRVDPRADHAYPVRSSTGMENGPFVVSAMAFLHFYDIQQPESLRWSAYVCDGVLCVDLDAEAVAVTSNRATPRQSTGTHVSLSDYRDARDGVDSAIRRQGP